MIGSLRIHNNFIFIFVFPYFRQFDCRFIEGNRREAENCRFLTIRMLWYSFFNRFYGHQCNQFTSKLSLYILRQHNTVFFLLFWLNKKNLNLTQLESSSQNINYVVTFQTTEEIVQRLLFVSEIFDGGHRYKISAMNYLFVKYFPLQVLCTNELIVHFKHFQ